MSSDSDASEDPYAWEFLFDPPEPCPHSAGWMPRPVSTHKYTPDPVEGGTSRAQARTYFLTGEQSPQTINRGFHMGLLQTGHLRYAPWTATQISSEEAQYLILTALYLLHRVIYQTTEYQPSQGPANTAINRALGAVIWQQFDWTDTKDLLNQDERGFLQALALRLSLTHFSWDKGTPTPQENTNMCSVYVMWKAACYWLGQLDPDTAAVRWPPFITTGCQGLQQDEVQQWMPLPPIHHRRTIWPPYTGKMVGLTLLHYTLYPSGYIPGKPPPQPPESRIQHSIQTQHVEWQHRPFQSLREM